MVAYLSDRLLTEDGLAWYIPCLDYPEQGLRSVKNPREDLDLILVFGVNGASHFRAGEASYKSVTF